MHVLTISCLQKYSLKIQIYLGKYKQAETTCYCSFSSQPEGTGKLNSNGK